LNPVASELGTADLCPCGSGDTYGKCCAKKGITYGTVACASGNKSFFYNAHIFEKKVNTMLHYAYFNIIEPYRQGISIPTEKALSHLQRLYDSLDEILEPFLKHSACKPGCKHCCHLIVDTTPIEAEMIYRYARNTFQKEEILRLTSEIRKNSDQYPEALDLGTERPDEHIHSRFDAPCPFFSDEWTCTIYQVRPLPCRMYVAFSPPEKCKSPENADLYEASFYPQLNTAVECLSKITQGGLKIERHLADWFINEFSMMETAQ
jgi:Fe-S-cluster containining protein